MSRSLSAFWLVLLAGPLMTAALEATVVFNQQDGSAVQVPDTLTLPDAGSCSGCVGLEGGSIQLRSKGGEDDTSAPVVITVAAAPGGTAVAFVGYGSSDCTGGNQTSLFTDFQSDSVAVSTDSQFPGSLGSFQLCVPSSK